MYRKAGEMSTPQIASSVLAALLLWQRHESIDCRGSLVDSLIIYTGMHGNGLTNCLNPKDINSHTDFLLEIMKGNLSRKNHFFPALI
jgi:hypothetical protein